MSRPAAPGLTASPISAAPVGPASLVVLFRVVIILLLRGVVWMVGSCIDQALPADLGLVKVPREVRIDVGLS